MLFIIKTNFLVDKTSIRPRNAFLTYFPAWQFDTQTLPQHHLFYHPTHRGEGTMIVAFWIHLGCRWDMAPIRWTKERLAAGAKISVFQDETSGTIPWRCETSDGWMTWISWTPQKPTAETDPQLEVQRGFSPNHRDLWEVHQVMVAFGRSMREIWRPQNMVFGSCVMTTVDVKRCLKSQTIGTHTPLTQACAHYHMKNANYI